MIVDAHVHVLPERLRAAREVIAGADAWFALCHSGDRDIATVDDLLAAMDDDGIDRSVCLGWPFADSHLCAQLNDAAAAAQRAHPDRITAFGIVSPNDPGAAAEVRRCADLGLRGIGELNCDAQGFALDDSSVIELAALCAELSLPWNLHCSEPVGHAYAGKGTATPERVAALAEAHPELDLICAHLGGGLPFYAHMPEIARLCQRLWFDTAAAPFLYRPSAYRAVIDLIGADRLLYGSDYPMLRAGRYLSAFEEAGLSQGERDTVLGGAAARLLDQSAVEPPAAS